MSVGKPPTFTFSDPGSRTFNIKLWLFFDPSSCGPDLADKKASPGSARQATRGHSWISHRPAWPPPAYSPRTSRALQSAIAAVGQNRPPAAPHAQAQAAVQPQISTSVLKTALAIEATTGAQLAQMISQGSGIDIKA